MLFGQLDRDDLKLVLLLGLLLDPFGLIRQSVVLVLTTRQLFAIRVDLASKFLVLSLGLVQS